MSYSDFSLSLKKPFRLSGRNILTPPIQLTLIVVRLLD